MEDVDREIISLRLRSTFRTVALLVALALILYGAYGLYVNMGIITHTLNTPGLNPGRNHPLVQFGAIIIAGSVIGFIASN